MSRLAAVAVAWLVAIGLSANLAIAAEPQAWKLKRDRDGIQIFTRSVDGSKFKATRGVTRIKARLSSLVALVQDTEACAKWADLCETSEVFEQVSASELYVYTVNDAPWPVTDRDVLAHVVWSQDPNTRQVTMLARAVRDRIPKRKGLVRIMEAESKWMFTPEPNGMVLVETEAHIDPGGPTPAWITNLMLVDSPFKTLANMRDLMAQGLYPDARFSYIDDRPTQADEPAASTP